MPGVTMPPAADFPETLVLDTGGMGKEQGASGAVDTKGTLVAVAKYTSVFQCHMEQLGKLTWTLLSSL